MKNEYFKSIEVLGTIQKTGSKGIQAIKITGTDNKEYIGISEVYFKEGKVINLKTITWPKEKNGEVKGLLQ